MRFGEARERCRVACPERPGAAHVDVEPGIGCGDLDVERLPGPDGFRNCPCGGQRAIKRGREHRTTVDPNDVVRAPGRKAHLQHAMRGTARVKHRTPPPLPVRIDQFADRRVEPRLSQRFDNEAALPIAVTREVPVLGLAAAANAEVRAYRLDALRACALDAQQVAAVRMAGDNLYLHHLARQRVGDIHEPVRRLAQCHRRGGRDGRS